VRYKTLQRLQRFLALSSFSLLLVLLFLLARASGVDMSGLGSLLPQSLVGAVFARQVAIISGHAGNDSGAVCTNASGDPIVTEAAINASVATMAAQHLRLAGASVTILDEYDPALEGLVVDVLLSLHADSCIAASGYKAARHIESAIPHIDDRLVACIDREYAAATGLTRHENTITHNMTGYHAFNRIDPQTPAAILELGFIGGDQDLLVNRPAVAAQGVANSILCFFNPESETANETTRGAPTP
jgi:N-acetylmuramoyl-L-alanine amidase